MDDDRPFDQSATCTPQQHAWWLASLKLGFAHKDGRSYLATKQHSGPLLVQKTLHPEGETVCHAIVIHPPGGVAGGDSLQLEVALESQSQVLLTTPGAGKWYKANHKIARQQLSFEVGASASLEWLPQENILFNGAQVQFQAEIHLSENACFAGWDIACLGRQAQGERWCEGHYRQGLKIYRNQRLIWQENANFSPQSILLQSKVGLGGRPVIGTFLIAASQLSSALLQTCRDVQPDHRLDVGAKWGITVLPEMVVARYVGDSSQCAKAYFERLWCLLRPWYLGKAAVRPRIWNT